MCKYQVANKTEAAIAALKYYYMWERKSFIFQFLVINDHITPIVNNGIITKSTFQGNHAIWQNKGGYVDIDLIVKKKDGSTKTIKG